jgi:predicted nuclease of restriction endonuclease-like RecB superfamily
VIATDIRLYDHRDHDWIATVLDQVERTLGQPWRILLERLEAAGTNPARAKAILGALRRVTGGRAERGRVAREVRGLVLGHPALDRDARDARLAAAACKLGLDPSDIEGLLWADIAKERPVTLPTGRPRESTLAAFANLDRIQRAIRRAREVRIRIHDGGHELVRTAARYGLLANVTREDTTTVLDITGPLALFHATTVYGRTLASLVPLLADQHRFALEVVCDYQGHLRRLHVESPVWLPPVQRGRRRQTMAERLARGLTALGWHVEREPAPIANGAQLLFPELVVAPPERPEERTWIELVWFATIEYLDARLAAYHAAGIDRVRLFVDEARQVLPVRDGLVGFTGRLDAEVVRKALTDGLATAPMSKRKRRRT